MKRSNQPKQLNGKELVANFEDIARDRRVFQERKSGKSAFDIALELNLPTHRVKQILAEKIAEYTSDIREQVKEEMALDVARADELIQHFMPIAKSVTEDWKEKTEAGKMVLSAIETRAKIFGYNKLENGTNQTLTQNNTLVWLRSEMPFIEKMVAAQATEVKPSSPPEGADGYLDLTFDA
jgi:hypothetical protein